MQLRMNVHTAWNGEAFRPGDVIEVEDSGTVRRWISNGIASRVGGAQPAPDGGQSSEEPEVVDLRTFTKARLAEYAAARNVELPAGGTKTDWLAILAPEAPASNQDEGERGEGGDGASEPSNEAGSEGDNGNGGEGGDPSGESTSESTNGDGGGEGSSSEPTNETSDGAGSTEGKAPEGEE